MRLISREHLVKDRRSKLAELWKEWNKLLFKKLYNIPLFRWYEGV